MLHKRSSTFCLPLCELHTSHNCCTISLSGVGWWVGVWQRVQCIGASTVWCRVRKAFGWVDVFRLQFTSLNSIFITFSIPSTASYTHPVRGENMLYFIKVAEKIKWLSKILFPFHYEFLVQPNKKTSLFLTECGGSMIGLLFRMSRLIYHDFPQFLQPNAGIFATVATFHIFPNLSFTVVLTFGAV
jgi:hypothetical protein